MSVQSAPLIFALKHLSVQWDGENLAVGDFLRTASLMQGDRRVPPASDATVEQILAEPCNGTLPQGMELKLLEMTMPDWPPEGRLAFHGLTAFGAGNIPIATACAQHVLRAHPECALARQLVSLLRATKEVRIPFGQGTNDAPNVPEIVAGEK